MDFNKYATSEVVRYQLSTVVLAEVPSEVSLSFSISGCGSCCRGCHTPELRVVNRGEVLTDEILLAEIDKYKGFITCVLFMGGDMFRDRIIELLDICKSYGLKTALYSGKNNVHQCIADRLDYLKVGEYKKELGGLEERTTNQRFLDLKNNINITEKFWR